MIISKYKCYIPLFVSAILQVGLHILETFSIINVNDLAFAIVHLALGLSFAYTAIEEAKRFRNEGKHNTEYRLIFGGGFICCAFLFTAVKYFVLYFNV